MFSTSGTLEFVAMNILDHAQETFRPSTWKNDYWCVHKTNRVKHHLESYQLAFCTRLRGHLDAFALYINTTGFQQRAGICFKDLRIILCIIGF